MTAETERIHHTLIEGLVGPHKQLYTRSPAFFHTVNVLVDLLPTWINAIAEHAEATDAAHAVTIKALEEGWLESHANET